MLDRRWSIFIDADDTLWRDNFYYERASKHLYARNEIRERWSYNTFIKKLNKIENERCKKLDHYAEKEYVRSVSIFCSKYGFKLEKHTERSLLKLLERRQYPETYPNVINTLKKLVKYGDLYLYTKGCKSDYAHKLKRTNLSRFFSGVISNIKTKTSFRELLLQAGLLPSEVIVIGDSYTNDILPALAANTRAIYVCNSEAWGPENPSPVNRATDTVTDFSQVLARITSYEEKY